MKFKPADVSPAELDMTPMIDIVFQLITFFMVINKFDQDEADERVGLPRDTLARPLPFSAKTPSY
jgi:biopolymer transport protein ExbD